MTPGDLLRLLGSAPGMTLPPLPSSLGINKEFSPSDPLSSAQLRAEEKRARRAAQRLARQTAGASASSDK